MEKEINFNIFSKKDARITILSMAVVCVIFLSQIFLFYRLYESNIDLLQRELNLAAGEIYKQDLDRRLKILKQNDNPHIRYYGTEKPEEVTDTTKVTRIESKGANETKGGVVTVNAAIEEFVSKFEPINLRVLDSIAEASFDERGIKNSFYTEIIDIEQSKVLETTKTSADKPWQILSSNEISVNGAQTQALRITLMNPLSSFYIQIGAMFVLSILLCFICLYSFYVHQRTLARQKEVSKLKNDLFADVSHEQKGPLHLLKMVMSSLAKEKFLMDLEKRARLLRIANREIAKMDDQRDMILTMTKDDEGFLELNYTDFDLGEVIAESVKRFEETAEKPEELHIEMVNEIPDNSMIRADKDHITLVVSNLIENAIKYSKTPTEININLYRNNKSVCFSVSGNGIGIPEESFSTIFDRYTRVKSKETNAKGYGIGLNYVKRMVEKHRGEVTVTSKLGEGSEFTVVIPQ